MGVSAFELAATLSLNSSEFTSALDEAKNSGTSFGESFAAVGNTLKKAMTFTAVIKTVGSLVTGFKNLASATASAGDRVDKMSQKLGLSRKSFQQWDYILSQNGTSIDSMQTAMRRLQDSMAAGADASDATVAAYKKLGLSMDDLAKMTPEQAFEAVVKAFQELPPGAEKSALAFDIFGKSGSELLPLLNADAGSIEELKRKAEELGIVLDASVIDAAVGYTDAMDTWSRTTEAAKQSLTASLMPAVTNLITSLTPLVAEAVPMVNEAMQGIVNFATGALESITKALQADSFAEGIKMIFADIFGEDSAAYGFIAGLVDTGGKILKHIYDGLTGQESPSAAIKGVFAALFGEESGVTKILNSVIDTGSGIIGAIKKGIEDDQPLGAIISNVFKEIFGSDGEGGATGVLGILGSVRDAGSGLISSIAEALGVEGVGDAIVGVFEGIFGKAGEGGAGGTGIIGLISNVSTTGGNLLTAIETALSGEDPGKGIKDIFKAVFGDGESNGGVAGIIKTVGDTAGGLFATIAGALGASETQQSSIREAFSGLFGARGIGKIISDVADAGGSLFSKIYGFLDGEMSFTELIDGMFDALFGETGIGKIISDLAGMGGSLFSTIFGGLNDDTANQLSIGQIFNDLFGAAGSIVGFITEGVVAFGSNIIATIYTALTGKETDAESVRGWIKTNVTDPITSLWQGIIDFCAKLFDGIQGAFNAAKATVDAIVTWIDTNITQPINSLFEGITGWVTDMIDGIAAFLGLNGQGVTVTKTTNTINRITTIHTNNNPNNADAQGGISNPTDLDPLPGASTGMDYVPYDEFKVRLHKGERVLTALENREYMRNTKLTDEGLYGGRESIDYNALGEAVANALAGLSINMDSRQVGQLVAPTVSQSIMQTANMRRY